MKPYKLTKLKKLNFTKEKIKRKTSLNNSQKSIIFLISFFILCFIFYKTIYYIYIIKENKKSLLNIFKYIIKYNTAIITTNNKDENTQINITNNNNNNSMKVSGDYIISNSYSNHLEDLILNFIFYNISNGFYIDIGNFSPNKMSVTKYFYAKGWCGLNIKPLGEKYNELINIRLKDININYYIGEKNHKKYYFQYLNETGNNTYHIISEILNEYIPKNKEIHFCNIDLKEDVRKILLGNDFQNYRPKIFCIECNNNTSTMDIPAYESFEYILNKNDYSFIYQYDNVRYYIDNKNNNNLRERTNLIDRIIKVYKNKKNKLN